MSNAPAIKISLLCQHTHKLSLYQVQFENSFHKMLIHEFEKHTVVNYVNQT